MCGISGVIGVENAISIAAQISANQVDRGTDATGIAWNRAGKIFLFKKAINSDEFNNTYKEKFSKIKCKMAISHNRAATSNIPHKTEDSEAHPFFSEDKTFVLLHNGVYREYAQWMSYLKILGHKFSTGIDSEVMCHMLEDILTHSKNREEAMAKFYQVYQGNVLVMFNDGELYGFAGNSNFIFIEDEYGVYIGSELEPVLNTLRDKETLFAYVPKFPCYVKVVVKEDGISIKRFGKWNEVKIKSGDWIFHSITFCDFCRESGVPCEKFNNKDRCLKCAEAGITEPKPYEQPWAVNSRLQNRKSIYSKTEDKSEKEHSADEIAFCSYCLLPHAVSDCVRCNTCGKYLDRWCLAKHRCESTPAAGSDFMSWIEDLAGHKSRTNVEGKQRSDISVV